jgi:hypothetical protein
MLDAQDRAEIVITVNPGVELIGVTRERFQVEVTMLPRSLMRSGAESDSGSGGGGVRGSYDFSQTNALWKVSLFIILQYTEIFLCGNKCSYLQLRKTRFQLNPRKSKIATAHYSTVICQMIDEPEVRHR